jgi:hypothetical protein
MTDLNGVEQVRSDGGDESDGPSVIRIVEAVLLATVTLLAAWSGFAAAKWSTESRLALARASTARTEASDADLRALEARNFDGLTFNAWFGAWARSDSEAMALAVKRFRPEFRVAFDAWLATDPANNPNAPPGPTYMPEYAQPDSDRSIELSRTADELYADGVEAGGTSDDYVRITVLLASVLFLVGISSHFHLRAARYGLVGLSAAVLAWSTVLLVLAPKPPV